MRKKLLAIWAVLLSGILLFPNISQSPTAFADVVGRGGGAASSVSSTAFPLLAPDGTAGAPSYSFSSGTGDGMYHTVAGPALAWALSGGIVMALNNSSSVLNLLASWQYTWNTDTGLSRPAAGIVKVTNGGAGDGALRLAGAGSAAAPTINMGSNANTGFWSRAGAALSFAIGGNNQFEVNGNFVETAASNTIGWTATNNDAGLALDTGLNRVSPKQIAFNAGQLGASGQGAVGYWGAQTKTLTESAATSFVQIAVASGSAGGGVFNYCIEANDATDFQSRCGTIPFALVNKAGTETCTVVTPDAGNEVVAVSAGTLTNTFTMDTTPVNGCNIQANAVSSLTQTVLRINYFVKSVGNAPVTVTPQ